MKIKSKRNFLFRKIYILELDQEEFNNLVSIDPTPQKKYVFWLTKKFIEENISIDDLRNAITEFDTLVNKKQIRRALVLDLSLFSIGRLYTSYFFFYIGLFFFYIFRKR